MKDFFIVLGIVIIGLVFLLGVFIFPFTGLHVETGKGEHTGYVTAIEKSGLIWKTGTAYFKSDAQSSQEDLYCVADESVYAQLQDASKNKTKVTVKHHSYMMPGVTMCNGEPAIITEVVK